MHSSLPPSDRNITLCEDETFHPQICLVALEPVSNFLILKAYELSKATSLALNRQEQKAKQDYEVAIAAHQGNLAKRKAFDSKTGKPMESSDVQKRLNEHFRARHTVADEAELSQNPTGTDY